MRRSLVLIIAVRTLIYGTGVLLSHYSLWTNAYDLSVFDYALWSRDPPSERISPA